MNKKLILGVAGLAIVAGVVGIATSTTYAARGGRMMGGNNATSTVAIAAQRDAMTAHRDAVSKAIAAGDYTAWKTAMSTLPGNGRGIDMMSGITEANFSRFVEMHNLMTQADAIRTELGLGERGNMQGGMHGRGQGMGMQMRTAVNQ
ncbi:MAG: hypothetical protein ACD_81C00218G0010 [uncultured bacterium]|uniref:Uncharacterized protein n=2 Tax=Candidatus Wolfeibacteriota TaxID=1752735 RepID=A0A0G1HB23_9BACT|nr:MAG: hypothetical protein ACD_81C00218G0010 [uncultured bacterium]KKR12782.1 MAG: hypothetical protein UT41_C0001G0326 [Candidatus Wolfebacteria bacterium GW2011_GWC2_39_22]KKT43713.1 MAG: hypothetical protein UW32_C0001G0305 [Candidatus Wolfebacteria bacterium GW2011_GWE2_44_13]HBI25556.1 hypothetical protein [Candidatus Wolfebacteria bacterium]